MARFWRTGRWRAVRWRIRFCHGQTTPHERDPSRGRRSARTARPLILLTRYSVRAAERNSARSFFSEGSECTKQIYVARHTSIPYFSGCPIASRILTGTHQNPYSHLFVVMLILSSTWTLRRFPGVFLGTFRAGWSSPQDPLGPRGQIRRNRQESRGKYPPKRVKPRLWTGECQLVPETVSLASSGSVAWTVSEDASSSAVSASPAFFSRGLRKHIRG